jgi:transposase
MRKIEFTKEEIKQLSYESIYHKHHIVRRRMQALLLKSQGLLHQEIAEILNISETTLREYFDLYIVGGIEALKELHYQGKANLLGEKKTRSSPLLRRTHQLP